MQRACPALIGTSNGLQIFMVELNQIDCLMAFEIIFPVF
jgi:hypothetical protein